MPIGRIWLTTACLAALVLSAPSTSLAGAAKWIPLPVKEAKQIARCLADHLVADYATRHPNKDQPGILTVTADLTEHPFSFQYGEGDPSEWIAEMERQRLHESCKPAKSNAVAQGDDVEVTSVGHWAEGPAATAKIECRISAIFSDRSKIIAHYYCDATTHHPPNDARPYWCGESFELYGYTALLRRHETSLELEGISQSEVADLIVHCEREKDPR